MSETFEVIRTGVLATVQDLGRWGYQRFGMSVSGAMDAWSLQVGNLLVGNARGEAGVEIAMGGLTLRATEATVVAICGADLQARLDGLAAPLWKSFLVRPGQELSWGRPVGGAWAYLAVAGGIDVPRVMDSKATYVRAGTGGQGGRPLARGDILRAGEPAGRDSSLAGRGLGRRDIPAYTDSVTARVILGPQEDAFAPEAMETFLQAPYELTPQSDRMGYRLKGAALAHRTAADILSEGLAMGSIQVPADGQPIVLMAERQTIGGYAKIATVISADMPRLAQLPPGGRVRFEAVDVETAQAQLAAQEQFLRNLEVACGANNITTNPTNSDE